MKLYFSNDLELIFRKLGITALIDEDNLNVLLKKFRDSYTDCFSELFNIPYERIVHINYGDIISFLLKKAPSDNIISLCDIGFDDNLLIYFLSTSRVYKTFVSATHSESHPIPILNLQDVNSVMNSSRGPFTILDDGIYSGSTLREVLSYLSGYNIKIQQIITYFNFSSFDYFNHIPINYALKIDRGLTIDRICERDILVGIPNAGFKYLNGTNVCSQSYITNTSVFHKHTSCPKNMSLYGCIALLDISEVFWFGVKSSIGDARYEHICTNILSYNPLDLVVYYRSML